MSIMALHPALLSFAIRPECCASSPELGELGQNWIGPVPFSWNPEGSNDKGGEKMDCICILKPS